MRLLFSLFYSAFCAKGSAPRPRRLLKKAGENF